jgi:hypothetical protein
MVMVGSYAPDHGLMSVLRVIARRQHGLSGRGYVVGGEVELSYHNTEGALTFRMRHNPRVIM